MIDRWTSRVQAAYRRMTCLILGHAEVWTITDDHRVLLHCMSCGRKTPGWDLRPRHD